MSEKRLRTRWERFFTRERAAALCAALAALLVLIVGLASQPKLYPADYGQYAQYMRQYGLALTENGELSFTSAVTELDYRHVSLMKLFTPSAGYTAAYAVALVRLLTAPFGLPFSADLLALVWSVALAFAVYLITYHLLRLLPWGGWLPAVILCLIFADGNFIAMLRGLYPEGGAAVTTLLYLGCVLWTADRVRTGRRSSLAALAITSVLFLKSAPMTLVFLPLAAAVFLWALRKERRRGLVSLMGLALACLLLFTGTVGAVRTVGADTDYFSDAARYESVFHVYLNKAERPSALLADFGLDETYLPDVGKTYYEDSYAHDPGAEGEADKLAGLTVGRTLLGYLSHPAVMFRALNEAPAGRNGYVNDRNVAAAPTAQGYLEKRTEGGLYSWIRAALPSSAAFYTVVLLAAGAALLILAFARVKGRRHALWALIGCALVCAALYAPVCVLLNGYSLCAEYMLYQVFLQDLFWIGAATAAYGCALRLRVWMTRYAAEPALPPEAPAGEEAAADASMETAGGKTRIRKRLAEACADRKKTAALAAALAVTLCLCTLLKPDHAACVNNGDYERMMGSIDLDWTEEAAANPDGTSLHWVFEEYDWTAPFNWQRLTPLKASYSLYFFASITRLFTGLLGGPMNTYALEWVMTAFAVAAILLLTWDLHPIFRQWTLLFSALLCFVLLSETSLSWYNGLFGEGCVMLGLLLSCACAAHVALMPRRGVWKRLCWFAALSYSLYILCTSKAQMLLAMPFAALLLLGLCIAHWPKQTKKRAVAAGLLALAVAFIGLGTVREYTGERNEDSGAQMHTMWQAYFYGIFMISDDPIGDMEALGVDTAMAPDIGKYVDFSEDAEYVYFPLSQEAKERFTDHVSTVKIIQWYVTHPGKMIYMLNHAASVAREIYTGFRAYKSQDYWDWENRDTVDGMGLWTYGRESMVPSTFWGYFVFYLCFLLWIGRALWRGRKGGREKTLLCLVLLFIMLVGIFQYPLSVLGNGFADNHKQLFCFSLCHDLLLAVLLTLLFQFVDARPAGTLGGPLKARWESLLRRLPSLKRKEDRHAVQLH